MIARKQMKRHQSPKVCLSRREKWLISEENPANQEQQPPKPEPMTGPPMPQEYCEPIDKTCKVDCPLADCPGTYSTGRAMQIHFRDHHPEDTIVVNQEGEYPRCDSCGMFVADTGEKHKRTKMCKDATTR
jgi:hypothetical protein